MLRCWDTDPAERPGFSELSSTVSHIIVTMKAGSTAPTYVNDTSQHEHEHYLQPVSSSAPAGVLAGAVVSDCSDADDTGDCSGDVTADAPRDS